MDFLKEVGYWVVVAILGKVFTDSLPDLHVRNVWRWMKTFFVAGAAVVVVSASVLRLREEKPVMSKEQQLMIGYIVIIIVGIICAIRLQQIQAERRRLNRALLDGE